METKLFQMKEQIDEDEIEQCSKCLQEGGLVAFPTETVYGLGADALDAKASMKIYAAKGRPSDNPLIVHIAEKEAVNRLAVHVSEKANKLMDAFWPGPMTLIFQKSDIVPHETTGGLETVAIRYPNHPVALALLKKSGVYVAAPSANTSGRPSPTTAQHVYEDLNGKIDMILDGGQVGIGIESTIVDMTVEPPVILRPGYITQDMLEEVIGEVIVDKAILENHQKDNLVAKAPGMKYKHYAPKGALTLVEGKDIQTVSQAINKLAKEAQEQGNKVAIIATKESMNLYDQDIVECIGSREDEESVARGLYGILRKMDDLQVDIIYSESFPRDHFGQAIMNRLLKAAAYHVLYV